MDNQPELFPDRLYLTRIDPDQNMRRFYRMTVQRDLFGGATLSREFGRIGSAGRVMKEIHRDEAQAVNALAKLAKEKTGRGYKLL